MREDVASVVYPVFRQALHFRERVLLRLPQGIDAAQSDLRARLSFPTLQRGGGQGNPPNPHFILACWIDEIFCLETPPWHDEWENRTFEYEIYHSKERAHLFWEEARRALAHSDRDALEICYLALLLGFRGEYRDSIRDLEDWRAQFEEQIGLRRSQNWNELPPELPVPPTDVPPLFARDNLRWLILGGCVIGALTVLLTTFTVLRAMGS